MIRKIAVTGTKGKSTTLRMLESGFRKLQYNVYGSYGIDGYYYNGDMVRSGHSCENYVDWNVEDMPTDVHLIEATSFVLQKDMLEHVELDCAIFTSFDKTEHQELHLEGDDYLSSKRKMFDLLKPGGKAVVCRDISDFHKVVENHESKVITYGYHPDSDFVIDTHMLTNKKMIFSLNYEDNTVYFRTGMLGEFNALNMAAAYIACLQLEQDNILFFKGLEEFKGFPGRLERFFIPKTNNDIIIDYAHTPESMESILELIKNVYPDKDILTVFGCGGNKSKTKRPIMGKLAAQYSNFVVLTNDNPRSENPMDIINDILKGMEGSEDFRIILDRSEAIKTCLSKGRNCVIAILGKGAEDVMMFGEQEFYHNDKICLIEWCYQNNLTLINTSHQEKINEN